MRLQTKVLNRFNPRKVKFLTLNVMAFLGLVSAMLAVLIAQDQADTLFQLTQGIIQSPIGGLFSTIKDIFV